MIWFISDLHFGHDKEFIYGPRGFKSVEEMNETQINNWNSVVAPEDDIYVLGDFFLGTDYDFIRNTLDRLNGRIHLIIGNHDTDSKLALYETCDKIVKPMLFADRIKYNKKLLYLSHYPTMTSNLEADPKLAVINLFGHTHSKDLFYNGLPFMYNVACDAHNNTPISIDQILADIKNEIKSCIALLDEK